MGIRDEASLSAEERAALAGLEARAMAEDPTLAAQLRADRHWRRSPDFHLQRIVRLADRWWVGALLTVAGLAITLISLSTSPVLGVAGLVIAAAGLLALSHRLAPNLAAWWDHRGEAGSPPRT